MAQLNLQPRTLSVGVPTKLNDNGPLNAVTGTLLFRIPPAGQGSDYTLLFQVLGSSTTGFSGDLQVASSGNVADLTNYKTTLITAAAPVAALAQSAVTPLVAGPLYAINITAFTGTSADLWVTLN